LFSNTPLKNILENNNKCSFNFIKNLLIATAGGRANWSSKTNSYNGSWWMKPKWTAPLTVATPRTGKATFLIIMIQKISENFTLSPFKPVKKHPNDISFSKKWIRKFLKNSNYWLYIICTFKKICPNQYGHCWETCIPKNPHKVELDNVFFSFFFKLV